MKKPIYFVGMPGSGKTTIGKKLSQELGWEFIDTDILIEEREQKSINTIFLESGESTFRDIEKEVLRSLPKKACVISTGGGMPCFFDNMKYMNSSGVTIYLKASLDMLYERVKSDENRPLLKNISLNNLRALAKEREVYYSQSHIKLAAGDTVEATVHSILEKLKKCHE